MTTPTNDIIIAGGGLAGLVQAIALAHEDIPSTIVEKGTHEQLIKINGLYTSLYTKEVLEEKLS